MSDYLWDKTGEPEEDVAQLENLLGTLKYRSRPLDIPAAAMPTAAAATAATRPAITTIFSRPRLALAASLLLTLLAGAWFVTRQGEPRREQQVADIKQGGTTRESAQPGNAPDKAIAPNTETDKHAPAAGGDDEWARSPEDKAVAVVAAVSTTKPRRASRPPVARRQKPAPRGIENAPAPREEVAAGRGAMRWQVEQPLTPQQREATEQLMLALRLASAKLNYAQREMLEIGRAGK